MKIRTESLQDTKKLALAFFKSLPEEGLFVTLTGDLGAGKTQFVRYVLEYLNVKEKVTSPSFVILNEYKTNFLPVYHFDLYRLENSGLDSIKEELREYSKENVITLVEWANFGQRELPVDKIEINIKYDIENYSTERFFEFKGTNDYYNEVIKKTTEGFNEYFNN